MEKRNRDTLKISDELCIKNRLAAIRGRMRRQAFLQTLTKAVFYGLFLLVILFIASRIIYLPVRITYISVLVLLGAIVISISLSFRHLKDLLTVACTVDRKMELKERFSTAFELIDAETELGDERSEFAKFQISDAANAVAMLDIAKISPYRPPRLLKAFPIPLLLIALSFTVPRVYEVPPPLNAAQKKVVNRAIQNLADEEVENQTLQKRLQETVKRLKTASDVNTVEKQLSALTQEVRKQKLAQIAINKATEAVPRLSGMDTKQLAAELETMVEQPELSPELQGELAALFARIAKTVHQPSLSDALEEIQGKPVTQKTLQDIVDTLRQIEQLDRLEQLETQLIESRKELALANIDMQRQGNRTANTRGVPGQEAGSEKVQGTLEQTTDGKAALEGTSINDEAKKNKTKDGELAPLTGDAASAGQVVGTQMTVTTPSTTDSQRFSRVFTGNRPLDAGDGDQPYQRFSDVVLSARREYAQAIENKRIPVRYQKQIKAYLEVITTLDEK